MTNGLGCKPAYSCEDQFSTGPWSSPDNLLSPGYLETPESLVCISAPSVSCPDAFKHGSSCRTQIEEPQVVAEISTEYRAHCSSLAPCQCGAAGVEEAHVTHISWKQPNTEAVFSRYRLLEYLKYLEMRWGQGVQPSQLSRLAEFWMSESKRSSLCSRSPLLHAGGNLTI